MYNQGCLCNENDVQTSNEMRSSDKQRFAKFYPSKNKNLSEEEKKKPVVYPSDKLSHIFKCVISNSTQILETFDIMDGFFWQQNENMRFKVTFKSMRFNLSHE